MFDVVIKNGTIIDGSGKKKFQANIGIKRGKIKKISSYSQLVGKKEIDAQGLYVAPGFIDILNHTDGYLTLLNNPTMDSMILQGVTTMICGNCGTSLAPLTSKKTLSDIVKASFFKDNIILAPSKGENLLKNVKRWANTFGVNITWVTFEEYLSEIKKKGISCNFGSLVGYNTCRRAIVGDRVGNLGFDEMKLFKKTIEDALSSGALGISLGLAYSHASFVKSKEILSMLSVLKRNKKVCSVHLRDEGLRINESVNEAIDLAKNDISVQISHFKTPLRQSWEQLDEILGLIDKTNKEGFKINFDVYPYNRAWLPLYAYLPKWISEGGKEKLLERLKDFGKRAKIIKDIENLKWNFADFVVSYSPNNKFLAGKKIKEIANNQKISIAETLVNLLISNKCDLVCFSDSEFIDENNIRKEIESPYSVVASDGVAYNLDFAKEEQLVHPRCFGAFPRFLNKYVKENKTISWEEAIKKITYLPAQKLGLANRGGVNEEFWADLTIFDPDEIKDKSTYDNPFQYSVGIKWVLVNGEMVVENGKHNKSMFGEVLKG